MTEFKNGDKVRIKDTVNYKAFRGYEGVVIQQDEGWTLIQPVERRPDEKNGDFWWVTDELKLVSPIKASDSALILEHAARLSQSVDAKVLVKADDYIKVFKDFLDDYKKDK